MINERKQEKISIPTTFLKVLTMIMINNNSNYHYYYFYYYLYYYFVSVVSKVDQSKFKRTKSAKSRFMKIHRKTIQSKFDFMDDDFIDYFFSSKLSS